MSHHHLGIIHEFKQNSYHTMLCIEKWQKPSADGVTIKEMLTFSYNTQTYMLLYSHNDFSIYSPVFLLRHIYVWGHAQASEIYNRTHHIKQTTSKDKRGWLIGGVRFHLHFTFHTTCTSRFKWEINIEMRRPSEQGRLLGTWWVEISDAMGQQTGNYFNKISGTRPIKNRWSQTI